jgi:integrase
VGERIIEQAIYNIIVGYADKLATQGIAPRDLQRTLAKLAHRGGSPLDQIQLSLQHDSIQRTEKYLGVEKDLTDAPCDHWRLKISS